jgi:hypothetical protein
VGPGRASAPKAVNEIPLSTHQRAAPSARGDSGDDQLAEKSDRPTGYLI